MCLGIARVYAKQKEIRDRNPGTTIFLNGGTKYRSKNNQKQILRLVN